MLESVYEECLIEELSLAGLAYKSQVEVPLIYKGKNLINKLRIDVLVEDMIIVELKAVEELRDFYKIQLLTYLKLSQKPKGLLINFNSTNITKSLVSIVTDDFALLKK